MTNTPAAIAATTQTHTCARKTSTCGTDPPARNDGGRRIKRSLADHTTGLHEAPVLLHDLAVGGQPPAVAQVADQVPVQGARCSCRRSPDSERPSARWTVPPIFSSNRIVPIGRVDAEVRADADLAEAARAVVGGQRALQVVVAALGARLDDLAVAELELDAVDVDARRATSGTVKRTRPFALRSSGPVKTSPLGMLRLPSELTQVRPSTLERQVGARRPRCAARARRAGARSARSWKARSSPQAATGSGWSRNSARAHEGREVVQRSSPPAAARAAVGHSVEHQRCFSVASRIGRRARATRAIRVGVDAGQRARVRRAPGCRASASTSLASAQREVGEVVEVARRARARRSRRRLAGQLDAQQRPGVALEDRALQLEQQRAASVVERTSTCWPAGRRGSSPASRSAKRGRRPAPLTAPRASGKCSARCSRSTSRIQRALVRRGDAEALQQLLLALGRHAGDRPAHGQALEQELDRALPRVLLARATLPCSDRRRTGGASRASARRAATSTSPSATRYVALGRAELLGACRARRLRLPIGLRGRAACSSCARTSPVSGSAWPGQAAAGSSAASLRIDARACSVSWLKAACGTRGCAVAAGLRVERVEAVADQREPVGLAPQRRSAPARGRAGGRPEAGDLVALLDRPGDLHRAAVPRVGSSAARPACACGRELARSRSSARRRRPRRRRARRRGSRPGTPSAGAAPRWSACAWPSTTRVIPPSVRAGGGDARRSSP